jgi:DNA-binding NarL/FixJ family response regulator
MSDVIGSNPDCGRREALRRGRRRISGAIGLRIVDSGEEALRNAAETQPDLALMDIDIRGKMDGFEVAELLRQRHDIPIIFLTGRADDATLERVRSSESFGCLLQPFRPEELKASIGLALIRHGREAHLIASGKTPTEIAKGLALRVKTVSTCRFRILEKMNLSTNAQLTHYAIKGGLVN